MEFFVLNSYPLQSSTALGIGYGGLQLTISNIYSTCAVTDMFHVVEMPRLGWAAQHSPWSGTNTIKLLLELQTIHRL